MPALRAGVFPQLDRVLSRRDKTQAFNQAIAGAPSGPWASVLMRALCVWWGVGRIDWRDRAEVRAPNRIERNLSSVFTRLEGASGLYRR